MAGQGFCVYAPLLLDSFEISWSECRRKLVDTILEDRREVEKLNRWDLLWEISTMKDDVTAGFFPLKEKVKRTRMVTGESTHAIGIMFFLTVKFICYQFLCLRPHMIIVTSFKCFHPHSASKRTCPLIEKRSYRSSFHDVWAWITPPSSTLLLPVPSLSKQASSTSFFTRKKEVREKQSSS